MLEWGPAPAANGAAVAGFTVECCAASEAGEPSGPWKMVGESQARKERDTDFDSEAEAQVDTRLGRTVALQHRASTLYQIH